MGTPYIALFFRAHGLSGGDIGLILGAPMLARMATGPALAVWADGFRLRRTAILIMAGLSALGYGALLVTSGFWPWLVAWFVGVTGFWVCTPLADVVTLRRAAREGFAYAGPRGMGSAAYVVANIAAGALIPVVGAVLAPAWITVCAALSVLGALALIPPDPVHEDDAAMHGGRSRLAGAGRLLRNPIFMLMLASAAFVQAAHGFYYAFSTLIWRAQGISPAWSGVLWGVGVGVEVCFLWFGEGLRRRIGPARLLVLGAAGSVLRWTALAFSPPLWLLFPIQALHSMSFTATFVAALELTERLAPREDASAAQSLNAALSFGLMSGLSTLIAGPLFDHAGAWGYLAMSALAGVGLGGSLLLLRRLRA